MRLSKELCLKEFDRIEALKKDWNTYEADPIKKEIIDKAKAFFLTLAEKDILPYSISPSSDGELTLYYEGKFLDYESFSFINRCSHSLKKRIEVVFDDEDDVFIVSKTITEIRQYIEENSVENASEHIINLLIKTDL